VARGHDDDPVDDRRLGPAVIEPVEPDGVGPAAQHRLADRVVVLRLAAQRTLGSWPCPQPLRTARSRASTARRLPVGLDKGPPGLIRHRVRAADVVSLGRVREVIFQSGVRVVAGLRRPLEADPADVQPEVAGPRLGVLVLGQEEAARPRVVRRAVIGVRRRRGRLGDDLLAGGPAVGPGRVIGV